MKIRSIAMPTIAAAVVLAFATTTGASATSTDLPPDSVNSTSVQDNSLLHTDLRDGYGVVGADVADGSLSRNDLSPAWAAVFDNRALALESDGPYPGSTKLQDYPGNGANSTEKVPADGKSHAVWVMCPEGKVALGGGYRVGADQGDAVASKIQVTASEPTQVAKDGDTYELVYKPIAGDAAGSVLPNGWLVEAINTGTVDATVRPFVTCVKIG